LRIRKSSGGIFSKRNFNQSTTSFQKILREKIESLFGHEIFLSLVLTDSLQSRGKEVSSIILQRLLKRKKTEEKDIFEKERSGRNFLGIKKFLGEISEISNISHKKNWRPVREFFA